MALDGVSDKLFSRRAMKAELLDAETELQLAYAWRDHRDECEHANDHGIHGRGGG